MVENFPLKEKTEYQRIIEDIKIIARKNELSIPAWELSIFNRR
jgi:hypothetical protein